MTPGSAAGRHRQADPHRARLRRPHRPRECRARIGCAIGKDNVIEAVEGDADLLRRAYVEGLPVYDRRHQGDQRRQRRRLHAAGVRANDDGWCFPLSKDQVVLSARRPRQPGGPGRRRQSALACDGRGGARLRRRRPEARRLGGAAAADPRSVGNNISTATALQPGLVRRRAEAAISGWQFNNSTRSN
jgi:hypothetical protein